MNIDWELAHSLTVDDGQGVRCACELPPLENDDSASYRLVVGTQGGALFQWTLPSQFLTPIPYQHDNGVTAILAASDGRTYVTGCKDSKVRVFDATTHELIKILQGHDKPVTSLAWVASGAGTEYLVTGSWDGTAKLWDIAKGVPLATLPNHENSVCVSGLPPHSGENDVLRVATGSAGMAQGNQITNHSVRLWKISITTSQVDLLHTVANDHHGPIRDISLSGDTGLLATCSNDGTVKLRTVETAECLETLAFPPLSDIPMLLSVASCQSGMVAAAEDGHVVFFVAAPDPQLVRHPSSVWTVYSLKSNGDVVTCCQDGHVRIFTQASDRVATQDVREHFAETVAATLSKQGPTADEVAKLPKWELNALTLGKSEGQVQLFQKNGTAIAAQWSAASGTWIEVGQVVGGPNNQNGNEPGVLDGVHYDHILPIEVDQTGGRVAKLQIGYNTGENPFVAAQRFIDSHMLPQHHLSEIADYIQQRVGTAAPTIGASTVGTSSSAVPVAGAGIPLFAYEHLPAKGYKIFDIGKVTNFERMMGKISEVGKLTDEEVATLKSMTDTLTITNRYHASKIDPAAGKVLEKMMAQWDPAQAFPALDLARLAVLHPDTSSNKWNWSKLVSLALALCEKDMDGVAVPMLTLRLIANCFKGPASAVDLNQAIGLTEKLLKSPNKNIRLSVATVLLNISSYLQATPTATSDVSHQVVTQANAIFDSKLYESEGMVRTLLALGTILLARPQAKEVAKSLYLTSKVEMAASPHGEKAKSVAKEIYSLMQ